MIDNIWYIVLINIFNNDNICSLYKFEEIHNFCKYYKQLILVENKKLFAKLS